MKCKVSDFIGRKGSLSDLKSQASKESNFLWKVFANKFCVTVIFNLICQARGYVE